MTRILIDSSAWIHFFNQRSRPHVEAVQAALRKDQAVTCGLIVTEVLHGARSEREQRQLRDSFDLLEFCELTRADYAAAAALGFGLRRKGVTVKTVDLVLIHLAHRDDLLILHDDADFALAARHLAIRTSNPAVK